MLYRDLLEKNMKKRMQVNVPLLQEVLAFKKNLLKITSETMLLESEW